MRQLPQNLRLSAPPPHYDVQDQAILRHAIENHYHDESANDSSGPWFDITDFGAIAGAATDQAPAILAAIAAANAAGGGLVYVPAGAYQIMSDIDMPRAVWLMGQGAGLSKFLGVGAQRELRVTGFATGAWSGTNEQHLISNLSFDKVRLTYGKTASDLGQGCTVAFCEFDNSDKALYIGCRTFHFSVIGCRFRINHTCVYFAFAEVNAIDPSAGSGAGMTFSDTMFGNSTHALYVNGICLDGFQINVTNCEFDHVRRCVKTVASGDGTITLHNINIELVGYDENDVLDPADGYFVENEGANIIIQGFWALSASQTAWFWNKSGYILVGHGRGEFNSAKFARIDGGTISVDQTQIISSNRWWSEGGQNLATASSTGGKIVAPRVKNVGRLDMADITMTNGSRLATPFTAGQKYDGNDRIWEFDVTSSAIGTDNTLRCFLQDGSHSTWVDIVMPLTIGGGRFTLVNHRGTELAVSGIFAPSSAVGSAIFLKTSIADNNNIGADRLLQFSSEGPGGTASTIVVSNLVEYILGPSVPAL